MRLMAFLSVFFSLFCYGSVFTAQAQTPGVDCSIADDAFKAASLIRGLSVRRPVPCRLNDKRQVEAYLRETVRKKYSFSRIENEGTMLRMLGMLPPNYDYYNNLIELYTSQIGGYYEPIEEYYVMAAWMPASMQMSIAVHELTHALQDQHFALDKVIDDLSLSSDEQLARAALVEGDATSVMLDYSHMLAGLPSISKSESVSTFMLQSLSGAMFSVSLRKAPSAIQAALLFPYVSGLNFVHRLLQIGGYREVDRAFSRLPRTTSEILHPELYQSSAFADGSSQRTPPLAPEGFRSAKATPVHVDTLGEFLIAAMLGTWVSPIESSSAAAGWKGDRAALYQGDNQEFALSWVTDWENEVEASEFFETLGKAYCLRYFGPTGGLAASGSEGSEGSEGSGGSGGNEKPCAFSGGYAKYDDPNFGHVSLNKSDKQVVLKMAKN